jgi:hypothetical protein
MSATKSINGFVVYAKTETSYGVTGSYSGTSDAVHCTELPEFTLGYAYDGARNVAAGTLGNLKRIAPSGRTATGKLMIEAKGSGSAYASSANTVPNVHALLLAAGLSGSYSGSAWTFTPTPVSGTPSSVGLRVYARGEQYDLSHGYTDFTVGSDSAAPAVFEFTFNGLASLPSDTSLPAASAYIYNETAPPLNTNIGFTVDAVTSLKVRGWQFALGRTVSPRLDVNASAGHAGFQPERRNPTLTVTVEAVALSTFNPYTDRANATSRAITYTVGATAGNRIGFSFPYAQLVDVKDTGDNGVATWELTYQLNPSTPGTDTDISISFS